MARYSFALMDEDGNVSFYGAGSVHKAINLRMSLFRKSKIIASSKIMKNTPDKSLVLPAIFTVDFKNRKAEVT